MIRTDFYQMPKVGGPGPLDGQAPARKQVGKSDGGQFDAILRQQLDNAPVKFSAHAQQRLQQRGIQMSPQDATRLSEAVSRAEQKGSRDSLVLLDDTALIVSVKNRTVVTAMDKTQMSGQVVTNIDSTVLA